VAEAFAVLVTNLEMGESRFKACCKTLQTVWPLQALYDYEAFAGKHSLEAFGLTLQRIAVKAGIQHAP